MKMKLNSEHVRGEFRKNYGVEPIVVRSPGRINLIGEHVDYNQGLVLPAAIDKEIYIAVGFAKEGATSTIHALNYDSRIDVDVSDPRKISEPYWANYLLGVLHQFKSKGYKLNPFNCVLGGNIPAGAGLSSSAALECGFALAVNELHKFNVSKADLIAMALWSEHNYVGVKCGIMDQFTSMMGKKDHVILLDCRSLDFEYHSVAFPGYSFVLIDSNVKHSLGSSEYNLRRSECEAGVAKLSESLASVRSLRDVSTTMLRRAYDPHPGAFVRIHITHTQGAARIDTDTRPQPDQ
jgi:galactokinase